MSLVAYAASSDSDEETDNEDELPKSPHIVSNGHISDEDEYSSVDKQIEIAGDHIPKKLNLNLPAPSKITSESELSEFNSNIKSSLLKLPAPKTNVSTTQSTEIKEEDDEFLHKKEIPSLIEKAPAKVKITIPSLSKFKHLEDSEKSNKLKPQNMKCIGLLNLLPKPKNQQFFTTSKVSFNSSLIPDSVKNLKNKSNSTFSKPNKTHKRSQNKKRNLVDFSDSDEDDNESNDNCGDFFSLNTEENLPEVSIAEINEMVAKRAAKMAEASTKIETMLANKTVDNTDQQNNTDNYYKEETIQFDENAIQALVGSQAKRKKLTENVQVVELTSAQVLPNKDEWLRTALASETSYQPKGILVDEEPAPGTRKKHQITYLAHQAKANEAELQAMWAANRQTRRATASKYGF